MRLGRTAVLIFLALICVGAAAAGVAPVRVLTIDGHIDPPTASYIEGGIKDAEQTGAQAVLILMDTPGGLMTSMQIIIKSFFASRVPVIVFVYPNGSTAASAGTFITMAADIAAMAPVSNIGSASPVSISPSGGSEKMDETMKRKVENFAVEYARSIAEKRGRNAEWAEKAVRGAANVTSTKALQIKVIDYIADSPRELLKKIDGKKVKLSSGGAVSLHTARAPLEEAPMSAWETFLHYLANPMVALFLMAAATYGIIYELANPGSILPGVVGAISIVLLLYSFSVIPVNAAGFAFVALAIAMFAIDLFTPSHGILTVGGAICLFLGLMMLFRSSEGFMVSIWTLAGVTLLTAGLFVFVVSLGVRAMRNPYVSGREGVVGHIGEARTDLDPAGSIFVDGSLWSATSEEGAIAKGEKVIVTEMTGLRLRVRKHEGG